MCWIQIRMLQKCVLLQEEVLHRADIIDCSVVPLGRTSVVGRPPQHLRIANLKLHRSIVEGQSSWGHDAASSPGPRGSRLTFASSWKLILKQWVDWFAVWQPGQRCRRCSVKYLHVGEETLARNRKLPQIGLSDGSLCFPRLESWNNTRALRENFFKGFWLFYCGVSYLSAIVHKAYIIHLQTICGSLGIELETNVFWSAFHPCVGRRHSWCILGIFPPFLWLLNAFLLLTQQILLRFNPGRQTEKWTWIETSVPALTLGGWFKNTFFIYCSQRMTSFYVPFLRMEYKKREIYNSSLSKPNQHSFEWTSGIQMRQRR